MLLSVLIRDMKKAELAVQKMRRVANSTQKIELFHLDLANLETVDQVGSQAQKMKQETSRCLMRFVLLSSGQSYLSQPFIFDHRVSSFIQMI